MIVQLIKAFIVDFPKIVYDNIVNNGWEEINGFPKWVNYDKLRRGDQFFPGRKYIKYFKGKHFRYKYVSYRGFENQGHGCDSYERYYRKSREVIEL